MICCSDLAGQRDFMKGIARARSVAIPVSRKAFLDALPQGRNIGSQVVHVLRAKRSLELYNLPVHVFQLFCATLRSALEFG
jgi:hypothetical protein